MPKQVESLWPQTISPRPLPSPVQILQLQGELLEKVTGGKLYGEVEQSRLPSTIAVTYDFYVGVVGKPFRHKLLSIDCGFLFDYPVTLYNHEAGTTASLNSEEEFTNHIRLLLNSPMTQDLLGRLLSVSRNQ